MIAYKDLAPTQFDPKGLNLHDQQEWLVLPVMRTRDSGLLAESNFAQALEMLGGEGEHVQVHRFNHWGPGWIEIVIVDNEHLENVQKGEEIEEALAGYPVLNESDLSEREWEEFVQDWSDYGCKEFIKKLKVDFSLQERTVELLEDANEDALREFYLDHAGHPYVVESSGLCIHLDSFNCTRGTLGSFVRRLKPKAHS